MILKIKAKIYQWFGVYLASKEELEYIHSNEFWKDFKRMVSHKKNDMSFQDNFGILIGSWQAHKGLYRSFKPGRYRRKK